MSWSDWWSRIFSAPRAREPFAVRVPKPRETWSRTPDAKYAVSEYRFHVIRVQGNITYQAYEGGDPLRARRAWEEYIDSQLHGHFYFYDGEMCRGAFARVRD